MGMGKPRFRRGGTELITLCERLGYGEELRSEGYSVLTPTGVVEVELACFGLPEPKDMSTATIIAGPVPDEDTRWTLRESARAMAAPVALLESVAQIELWRIAPNPHDDRLLEQDLRDGRVAARLMDALAPESLVAHKRGLSGQLALFDQDVRLLSRARAQAELTLGGRVEAAMADLWPYEDIPSADDAAAIAHTVVQALALLVARDKMTADRQLDTALAVLQEQYGKVVAGLSSPSRRRLVQRAASIIGDGVAFDGLDATILGDVYEGTFLQEHTRRHLGAYYTPPEIARKMLDAIPVEDLAPEDRTALDLTCGSGTLLLASWDRLAAAELDAPSSPPSGGTLTGYDRDPFAVDLARLALVIHDAPGRPTWNVGVRDALDPRAPGEGLHSLVVGNPPWGYERREGVKSERATAFLEAMLRWCSPDGFLACLLPASWLTAAVASSSRAALREGAEIFEIWRLPETTFELSSMASCVVFARKREAVRRTWLYRRVRRARLESFLMDIRAAPGELIDDVAEPDGAPFRSSRIEGKLAGLRRLIDVAEIRRGVPTPRGKARGSETGNVQFLPGYRDLCPFDRVRAVHLVPAYYPDDFSKRGESSEFWTRSKVLVATTTNVDGHRRARAFLDGCGVVPRNSMTAVVPRENTETRRLALLAILNSSVVEAWLDSASMRWIGSDLIENIPVPADDVLIELADIAEAIVRGRDRGDDVDEQIEDLDRAVSEAYETPIEHAPPEPDELAAFHSAEITTTDSSALGLVDEPQLSLGTVLDVCNGEILLHVAGITPAGGVWMPPPPAFPGWACRPRAGLQVLGVERGLNRAVYLPQGAAWLRDAELPAVEART